MGLLGGRARHDKIFINYRRGDSGGYAGRLSDSLSAYFGVDRVFRDVTGIGYGADFEAVIDERVAESGALVVLIGENWTTIADEAGRRRLDDPDDYVVREIAGAFARHKVVVPVLIGNAAMPRREKLPPALAELTRRNAITITDERWTHDVERLARVLAIDLPGSVAQRRLDRLKAAALAVLGLAGLLATLTFSRAAAALLPAGMELREAGYPPLLAAIPFMALLVAGTLALVAAPMMERARRPFAWAATGVAAVGSLAAFITYAWWNEAFSAWSLVALFAYAIGVTLVVLVLLAFAGFRAR